MSQNIDQLNAEFFKRLHGQFPELTKSELELCGLTIHESVHPKHRTYPKCRDKFYPEKSPTIA
jgi:hypothetical protein